jgi:hypothetical protein
MNNFLDEFEKWKSKDITEKPAGQDRSSILFPYLFYTEYTCPFFVFYFINQKPYLFNPYFTEVFRYSALIEYYLERFNILINPRSTLIDSIKLYQYLTHIVNIDSIAKVYEISESGERVKIVELKQKNIAPSETVKKIYNTQKQILTKKFEDEYLLLEQIRKNNILSEYYYFCEKNCPYFHICKVKDKL